MFKARKNDVYVSLIDGLKRKVSDVSDEFVLFDDGSKFEGLEAFRLVEKAPVTQIAEDNVQVINGKLSVNGENVEVGTLKILGLVSTQKPGKILLTAKSLKENLIDIFEYNAETDEFKKLIREISSIEMIHKSIEGTVFKTNKSTFEDIKVMEGDEVVDKKVELFNNKLFIYNNSEHIPTELIGLATHAGEATVKTDADNLMIVFKSNKRGKTIEDIHGDEFDVLEDVEEQTITQLILKKHENDEDEEDYFFEDFDINVFTVEDEILAINATHLHNDSLFIVTKGGIIFTNNGYSPRHAKGDEVRETALMYPHFVELKPGTRHNEFVLANTLGRVVTIKVTKTDDRGYITEVIK